MKKQASKKQITTDEVGNGATSDAVQADLFASPEVSTQTETETKPKAKQAKKKALVEAAPQVPAATPVKKAARKAKSVEAEPVEAEGSGQAVTEAAITDAEISEASPMISKKPGRKAKGRDLVVDEPGAAEVADVLGTNSSAGETSEDQDLAGTLVDASEGITQGIKGEESKLERLQKILAKAGISSRRKAEELILGGRVQINGKVVMELGTKADMARDHVRVDGKLLQGAERIRYFVLNKPKGFVTTVSDPEGRPTVMQFFSGERERLYPVGRLDYLSEGLLLVTNDGELANKLTKAASGVEKTYLVKVAGHPTEDMLDVLRKGVVIERGRPGTNSGRVRTAPAQIRQVRQGDNPWYEVIVIEGRNRELRKMFEEIGHHVEKIRRVGYGPLVLDLEPGRLRELEAEEVHSLRLAAEGKLKTGRRKSSAAGQLPTVAGKTVRYKQADGKPGFEPRVARTTRPEFQQESKSEAYPATRRIAANAKANPPVRPTARFNSKSAEPGAYPATQTNKPINTSANRSALTNRTTSINKSFDQQHDPRPEFRAKPVGDKPAPRGEFRGGGKPAFKGSSRPSSSPSFGAKPRRVEPPVTEFVLPPRKAMPPDEFDDFDSRGPKAKSDFQTGSRPSKGTPFKKASSFQKDRPAKRFGGSDRFDETGASTAPPFSASPGREQSGGTRIGGGKFQHTGPERGREREDYPDAPPEKRVKLGIEPVVERAREERPRTGFGSGPRGGFNRAGGGAKSFRPADGGPTGARSFRPRSDGRDSQDSRGGSGGRGGPDGPARDFRPRSDAGGGSRPTRPYAKPAGGRSTSDRPTAFRPAKAGGRPGSSRPFEGGGERTSSAKSNGFKRSEFRPTVPKKFGARPAMGGSRAGADGPTSGAAPVKKERWRNSFTGKNKGRPKPKDNKSE